MPPAFSTRTAWDLSESSLSYAIRQARETGKLLLDLTVSNPTACGFSYDSNAILAALQNSASLVYDPDPRGILSARTVVSEYYLSHQASVDPQSILLTTSTSEAYSFLFRLLCNPGDELLAAQPSYPLFDLLATLDDVQLRAYPLFYDFGWWIDFAELERRITPRTRAILLVHPNNPTGHATSASERQQLEALCARHNLALIVDEVFLDYSLASPIQSFAAGEHPCLTFVVSGLSKIAALPQMKVGWLAAFGPGASQALARLEIIADTFLSMNAPAQHALPAWLAGRELIQRQILARTRENLATLSRASNLECLPVQAGWAAILQVSPLHAGPALAETLAETLGLILHPGSFYGIAGDRSLVLSLIVPNETLRNGIETLNHWFDPGMITTHG